MRDELQEMYLPKFNDDDEMYFFTGESGEALNFSHFTRPRFDDNDEMYFEDEEIHLEAIA